MELYNEKYRPQYHFSPEEKWMNDPNGMVYYNGEYHLFYQYHPHGTTWGPMHWGHAISKDLVTWEHLPIALKPDEHGDIFSGSAVVDWNDTTGFFDGGQGLVAIFTHADMYPESERPRQRQSLAYSKDNGRTWVTFEGNPVLSDVTFTDFRDPKVFWHHQTQRWIMSLACGTAIRFYSSTNLKEWVFLSEFSEEISHKGVWECPDLFQLPIEGTEEKKWVLIVSLGDDQNTTVGSRSLYFIGEFDGTTFKSDHATESILWLDHGRDNYAGVSFSDIPQEDSRRIYMAWMSNWRYANLVPTQPWRSAMTIPRELILISTKAGIRIKQYPVREFEKLKSNQITMNTKIGLNESTEKEIYDQTEINITFETKKIFTVDLGEAVISYDSSKNKVSVERTAENVHDFNPSFLAKDELILLKGGQVHSFRILVDRSSLEIFINGGEESLTYLLFPTDEIKKLKLSSIGCETIIHALDIHQIEGIWNS